MADVPAPDRGAQSRQRLSALRPGVGEEEGCGGHGAVGDVEQRLDPVPVRANDRRARIEPRAAARFMQPLTDVQRATRRAMAENARSGDLGNFLQQLAKATDGSYGVGFGDVRLGPPGAPTRPSTDK